MECIYFTINMHLSSLRSDPAAPLHPHYQEEVERC